MSRKSLNTHIQSQLQTFATYTYLFQQQVAEQLKLHSTDLHCIHLLSRHGALSAGQLAAYLHLTTGATTAAIDRLCTLGFARRFPASEDRRRIMVEMHPKGSQRIGEFYVGVDAAVQHSLQKFSEAELQTIHRFLGEMTAIELGVN